MLIDVKGKLWGFYCEYGYEIIICMFSGEEEIVGTPKNQCSQIGRISYSGKEHLKNNFISIFKNVKELFWKCKILNFPLKFPFNILDPNISAR